MKVHYDLEITASVERTGAWEDDCTISQVVKQAQDDGRVYKVLIQRGNQPPVEVTSQVTVKNVRIVDVMT